MLQEDWKRRRTFKLLQRYFSDDLGTLTPLIGIGFQASCMFFFCEFWKRYFSKFKENPNDRLSISLVALSAALASGPTSLIAVTNYLI